MKFNLAQIYNEPMTQAQFENLLREVRLVFSTGMTSYWTLNGIRRRVCLALKRHFSPETNSRI
jgi:hypothetical protein